MAGLKSLPTYEPGDRPAGKPPGMAPECWNDRVCHVTAVQRDLREAGVTAHAELDRDAVIVGSLAFDRPSRETVASVLSIFRDHGLDVEQREQVIEDGGLVEVIRFSDDSRKL